MSSTGRNLAGNERHEDDFYATPAWAVRAILPKLPLGGVLDPAAGEGAILDVVAEQWRQPTYAIEIDADRSAKCKLRHLTFFRDALSEGCWVLPHPPSTIVANPPFLLAREFIERAAIEFPLVDRAFLLRLNFLGSKKRVGFHGEHPSDVFVLPRRPSFATSGKTDSTEYAWFVFGPNRDRRYEILDVEWPPSRGSGKAAAE